MKTKAFQESVLYTAPTFQEALILAPLMDQVYDSACKEMSVKAYNELPKEERAQYRTPWTGNINNAIRVYEILTAIGFCTSHGNELKASFQKKPSQEA